MAKKLLKLNRAQLLSVLESAPTEVDMWGRAGGKTTHAAWKTQRIVHEMARSNNTITGRTFGQLKLIVVPQMMAGWADLGYFRDVHYVVGHRPPRSLRYPDPIKPVLVYDHTIHWYTGACYHLVSQDREGMGRGYNSDSVMADEGLTLLEDRFRKETLSTNRGNEHRGWKTDLLHSVTIYSSKPLGTKGHWLLKFGEYYKDAGIELDLLNKQRADLELAYIRALLDDSATDDDALEIWDQVVELKRKVRYFTCQEGELKGVFYNEANAFDNIENLGMKYIFQQYRDLTELEFRVEILNQTLKEIEDGFYFSFNEVKHTYREAYNYSFLDEVGWDMEQIRELDDCRKDSDIDPNSPLDIAGDYGFYLNCLVVAQERRDVGWKYRYLKALWLKPPYLIEHVAEQFCRYYAYHKTKVVNYYYDQTAIDKAGKHYSYYEQVVNTLEKHGWTVNAIYIGQVPSYEARYNLWAKALQGIDNLPMPEFNYSNCKYLVIAMQLTGVRQGQHGIEKDKRPEKNKKIPQEEAPHLTDGADTLLFGKFIHYLVGDSAFVDTIV